MICSPGHALALQAINSYRSCKSHAKPCHFTNLLSVFCRSSSLGIFFIHWKSSSCQQKTPTFIWFSHGSNHKVAQNLKLFFFAKSSNHAAFCFSTMLPYDNNPNARVRGLTKFRSISPETCDARELWKNERFTVQVANSQLFWSEMILGDDLKRAKSGCLFHITFYHVLIFNMLYIYIYVTSWGTDFFSQYRNWSVKAPVLHSDQKPNVFSICKDSDGLRFFYSGFSKSLFESFAHSILIAQFPAESPCCNKRSNANPLFRSFSNLDSDSRTCCELSLLVGVAI